jgi:HemY protein
MRFGVWALAALVVGALTAHFLLADNGYVLINFRGYLIEMSVPALVVLLAVIYVAARFIITIVRAPRRLGEAVAGRRMRRAGSQLTRGMIQISEGNWAQGERLLTRGIKGTDSPLVNYLMAARAAQEQGSRQRRNEWLKLAYEQLPEAETTVLLTQAELQFDSGEYEQALATLMKLADTHPDHPMALGLLARTYAALDDRTRLRAMLPKLERAHLSDEQKETLALECLRVAEAGADFELAALKAAWSELSPKLRRAPRLQCWRALALDRLGAGDEAESALRSALKRDWDAALVRAYGEVKGRDPAKQLRQAERWLKDHDDDGILLLTAARLCLANELWGKARSYLESSLALAPEPASYALYGRLLSQLGETENAAVAYRSGLGMVSDVDLSLPALEPPEASANDASRRP